MINISDYDVRKLYGLNEDVEINILEELLKNDNDFVAKIDYLNMKGKPAETFYFINKDFYMEEVEDAVNCGVPIFSNQLKGTKIDWNKDDECEVYGSPEDEMHCKSSQLERSIF